MQIDSLKNRSFNIRISFDENGDIVIGHVHGLYDVAENITDIKKVPEEEKLMIAKAIGASASSESFSINRQLRKTA